MIPFCGTISQTVLGAIQCDSYGYQTFFANRIVEIQKTGVIGDWWWIPGSLNIADIITRGASPKDLDKDSMWQNGTEFLKSVNEWPKRSAAEIADDATEKINKLLRNVFSVAVTRAQMEKSNEEEKKVSITEGSV